MAAIDFSGARLDLVIRAGADVLVVLDEWRDDAGALIDFTSGAFDGSVSKRADAVDTPQPLAFENVGLGTVTIRLPDTAGWDAGSFFQAKSTYNYAVWYTDAAGDRTPQLVGDISVYAGAPQ